MTTKTDPTRHRRAGLRARTAMTGQADSPNVLLMRKDERRKRWPYETFSERLDELMVQAGIPLTSKGTPNTVAFEEMTGVSPGRVSYWRTGYNQPTIESLRAIAEGLAPHVGVDPLALQHELEVAAGRRSGRPAEQFELPDDLDGFLERARRLAAHPGTSEERRRELKASIAEAEFRQRAARDMEREGEDLLRRALGETENQPES